MIEQVEIQRKCCSQHACRNTRKARWQAGISLVEALTGLAIASVAMAGVITASSMYLDDLKATSTAEYQKTLTMAAAKYIDKNHLSFAAGKLQSITLKNLIDAGDLPQGIPSTNAYGQTPCLLVKKLQRSKNTGISGVDHIDSNGNKMSDDKDDSYADDGAIFGVLVTEGGSSIPDGTLNYIASLSGDGGGYIPLLKKQNTDNTASSSLSTSSTPTLADTPVKSKNFYRDAVSVPDSTVISSDATNDANEDLGNTSIPSIEVQAKGVYGTWSNSLTEFVSANISCSGTPTSAHHLASLVPWKGSRGVADFLYRNWIPGNANADANKMLTDLYMSPSLKIAGLDEYFDRKNINNVKVADARYITFSSKSTAQKDHICDCSANDVSSVSTYSQDCPDTQLGKTGDNNQDPKFSMGTMTLDSEDSKNILACTNGTWKYLSNIIPKIKAGPECHSYSDKKTTHFLTVAGAPTPAPVNDGDIYAARCKRFCPRGTRLAFVQAQCREANAGGIYPDDRELQNFTKYIYVNDDDGREGVELECQTVKDTLTRPQILDMQLYCRDYDDDMSTASTYTPTEPIDDKNNPDMKKVSSPNINDENGGCWIENLATYRLERVSWGGIYNCATKNLEDLFNKIRSSANNQATE